MATKAKSLGIDPDSIDLLGRKKDAALVVRYAREAGVEALPFLRRAFTEASVDVRRGVVEAIAQLDARLALTLVDDALTALLGGDDGERTADDDKNTKKKKKKKKVNKKDRQALVDLYLVIGTPDALSRAFTAGVVVEDVPRAALPALVRFTAERCAEAPIDAEVLAELFAQRRPSGYLEMSSEPDLDDALLALARAVLARTADHADALAVLLRVGGLEAYRRAGHALPAHVVVDVARSLSAADRFALLAPLLDDPSVAGVVISRLRPGDDERFVPLLERFEPSTTLDAALAAIGGERAIALLLERARRPVLDVTTKGALAALAAQHRREVLPVLLSWLDTDAGRASAPMLLAAVASVANADDAAAVEALAAKDPAHAAFFSTTVRQLREGASAAT